jgi:hypothetical protein
MVNVSVAGVSAIPQVERKKQPSQCCNAQKVTAGYEVCFLNIS